MLTSNGDITIFFPEDIDMSIIAEVGNGTITSNVLPVNDGDTYLEVNWPLQGDGNSNFTINTSNGNIRLDIN